jgi:hypothetical protein
MRRSRQSAALRVKDLKLEIGRFLHLKFEIRNRKLDWSKFAISDFQFEMQESSNLQF